MARLDRYNTHFIVFHHLKGVEVAEEEKGFISSELLSKFACVPVFVPDAIATPYYSGFSNRYQAYSKCVVRFGHFYIIHLLTWNSMNFSGIPIKKRINFSVMR